LNDLFNVLTALEEFVDHIVFYVPKMVYDIIILQPEEKFRLLPSLISEWVDPDEDKIITKLDNRGRMDYVSTMRKILISFTIKSFSFIAEGDDKIGRESIRLQDLIKKIW
jgi:hypothetical protein